MMKRALLILFLSPLLTLSQSRTPLNRSYLQSNMDGNQKSITNVNGLGPVTSITFADGTSMVTAVGGFASNSEVAIAGPGITIVSNGVLRTFISTNVSGTFTGNGEALTNLQNMVWKTVSARGIANGLSTLANDGKDFGPDTAGTTTSGLQEAIDSFPRGSGDSTNVYVAVQLSGGTIFYTNNITYSNYLTHQFFLKGVGMLGTRLVYAGTNVGTPLIWLRGGGYPGASIGLPSYVNVEDMTLSSIYCRTNVVLNVTNENYVVLRNLNVSGWKIETGEDWFSTVDDDGGASYSYTTNGLVGAVLGNVNDGEVLVENCQFGFLAVGLHSLSDHLFVNRFIGVMNGKNSGVLGGSPQTAWPSTHVYRIGSSILRRPGLDTHLNNVHCYDDKAPSFAYLNHPGSGVEQVFFKGLFLEGDSPAIAAINTNAAAFLFDAWEDSFGTGIFNASQQGRIDTNNWTVSQAPLPLHGTVYNNPAYLRQPFADGGFQLRTGPYIGSGSLLSNVPGLLPISSPSLSTNSFFVAQSGSLNLDGFWYWSSSRLAYTNASKGAAVGALVDNFSGPPTLYLTFTNATHPIADVLATASFSTVTNALVKWVGGEFLDPITDMFAFFGGTTTNQSLFTGRLNDLRVQTDSGGTKYITTETSYVVSSGNGSAVTLPDVRTNAGRIILVKNGVATDTIITTVASQKIDGQGSFTLTNETDAVVLQAIDAEWRVMANYSTNTVSSSGGSAWSEYPAYQNVNMDGWGLTNLGVIFPQEGSTVQIIGADASGTFTGDGAGLTNLPASSIVSGTLSYLRTGSLTNHNDVTITSLAAGHHLAYSGTVWTNGPHGGGGGGGSGGGTLTNGTGEVVVDGGELWLRNPTNDQNIIHWGLQQIYYNGNGNIAMQWNVLSPVEGILLNSQGGSSSFRVADAGIYATNDVYIGGSGDGSVSLWDAANGAYLTITAGENIFITTSDIQASGFSGSGANLTTLNASALASGTIPYTRAGSLTNHNDVTVTSLTPGDHLAYSGTAWTNGPSGGGGGAGGFTNMMVGTITYGTTITPNLDIAGLIQYSTTPRRITFRCTLTGDITTVAAPTGTAVDGDVMVWEMIQDGTGSRLISGFNSIYAFGTDITGITLTTTASKRDFISWTYNSTATKWYCTGFVRGY